MSRSIHTTRRDLDEVHYSLYRDQEKKEQELQRLRGALRQKRRTKYLVQQERGTPSADRPIGDLDAIKIRVADEGPYIHYPASVDDIRNVMRRLPPGVVDGISEIVLSLETETQVEVAAGDPGGEDPDPLIGRLGFETYPGVFVGRILGTRWGNSRITLNAYVYDARNPGLQDWMILLRLKALSTLVHELAHHFDHTDRVGRGRWLADEEKKVESYAEEIQYIWTQKYVVPYLEATYPAEVKAVQEWISHYGSVKLSLEQLAPDPREHQNALLNVFSMRRATENLASEVAAGESLTKCRLNFAWELHAAEMYEPALEAITVVLNEEPANHEALTLRADIYVHQGRFGAALTIVQRVLSEDSSRSDAWCVLVDGYEGLEQWDSVIDAATQMAAVFAQDDYYRLSAFWDRASAFIKKGMEPEAEADIRTLEASGPKWAKRAKPLRKKIAQGK
jgi:tetratricopeptide (TPR) repeat protein